MNPVTVALSRVTVGAPNAGEEDADADAPLPESASASCTNFVRLSISFRGVESVMVWVLMMRASVMLVSVGDSGWFCQHRSALYVPLDLGRSRPTFFWPSGEPTLPKASKTFLCVVTLRRAEETPGMGSDGRGGPGVESNRR